MLPACGAGSGYWTLPASSGEDYFWVDGVKLDRLHVDMSVGESTSFTATLTEHPWVRMTWSWSGPEIEVPGVLCEPRTSCAIVGYKVDSLGWKELELRLNDARTVLVRVDGISEGLCTLSATAFTTESRWANDSAGVRVRPAAR